MLRRKGSDNHPLSCSSFDSTQRGFKFSPPVFFARSSKRGRTELKRSDGERVARVDSLVSIGYV